MPATVKICCHGMTDLGRVRPHNEDQFLVADLNKALSIVATSMSPDYHGRLKGGLHGKLLMVADGMGGHAAGQVASKIAVRTIEEFVLNTMDWFFRLSEEHEDDLLAELEVALKQCQSKIEENQAEHPEHHGMGTTLTMAYVIWPRLYVLHAGDSRCYLLREGRLEQITTDHTMAQKFIDSGALQPAQAEKSRWSNVLWNAVGGHSSEVVAEVHRATLQVGDKLLVCSDGLSKYLDHAHVLEMLGASGGPEATCAKLIAAANEAGGSDNITVVVADFQIAPPESDPANVVTLRM